MFSWDQPLRENIKTLFHYLSNQGYEIGSFVFDEKYLFSQMPFTYVQGHSRDFNQVIKWIRNHQNKPFFLFLHGWRTHIPWVLQSSAQAWTAAVAKLQKKLREDWETGRQECIQLYQQAIEAASEIEIASLVETLRELRLFDDTLLIVMADHGESWGERIRDKSEITDNFALHGRFLYEECLRVPLILHCPNFLPAGIVFEPQIRTIDICPSILDFVEIEADQSAVQIEGQSLKYFLLDNVAESHNLSAISCTTRTILKSLKETQTVSFMDHLSKLSITDPPWKFILSIYTNQIELYNLTVDPGERNNCTQDYPDIVDEMTAIMQKELATVPQNEFIQAAEVYQKRLKELGYL
jgi:arylsulfatase A-like enzyme